MDLKNHKSLEKDNLQKHIPKTFLFYHEMPPIFLQGKFSVLAVLASKQPLKQRIWRFEIPINAPHLHDTVKRHKKDGLEHMSDWMAEMMIEALPEDKRPGACITCRSCEKVCPQQIKISEALKTFHELIH